MERNADSAYIRNLLAELLKAREIAKNKQESAEDRLKKIEAILSELTHGVEITEVEE